VEALSIAPRAKDWLLETTEAWSMYTSNNVCNLINSHENVISITTPPVHHGPFSVMIPPIDLSLHINTKTNVRIFPSRLQVGALEIDTKVAQYWDPQPPWSSLRRMNSLYQDGLQIVMEVLAQFAPPESLAGLVIPLPKTKSQVDEKIRDFASEPANQLITGLRADNLNLCVQGAKGLAGLGVGYTPDGDDWILGSLLAVWLSKPPQEAKRFSTAIAEAAIPLTTTISGAWIRAASRGECSEPWHDFINCLSVGNEDKIREASKQLVTLGHTSGASGVAGFLAVLKGKKRTTPSRIRSVS
jgi:hypothetical protein